MLIRKRALNDSSQQFNRGLHSMRISGDLVYEIPADLVDALIETKKSLASEEILRPSMLLGGLHSSHRQEAQQMAARCIDR
jgi:hypothetical protein